ncbi:MAG: hypothetical protein ACR2HM_00365 [Acidimicrobiales bacterium]
MVPDDSHRHLDDEELNAVHDGEADDADVASTAACSTCTTRLDRFRAVAGAVAVPPAGPDADRRRSAIASAVASSVGSAVRSADAPEVVPFAVSARRRRPWSPAWAAAAAVVLAGALAVPLIRTQLNSQGSDEQTLAESSADDADGESCPACSPTAPDAALASGDLGEIDLGRLDELAASLGIGDLGDRDTTSALAGGGTGATVPGAETSPDRRESARDLAPETPDCQAAARQRQGDLGPLLFVGQGQVEGRAALVLTFAAQPAGATSSIRLLVLDAGTCNQLGSTTS